MNWLKRVFSPFAAIAAYFKNGTAARNAQTALEYAARALPYVRFAADLTTKLTTTRADDVAWVALVARYPEVFDGSPKTGEQLKRAALQIAAREMQAAFPQLSTSVAIAAAQLAYLEFKEEPRP